MKRALVPVVAIISAAAAVACFLGAGGVPCASCSVEGVVATVAARVLPTPGHVAEDTVFVLADARDAVTIDSVIRTRRRGLSVPVIRTSDPTVLIAPDLPRGRNLVIGLGHPVVTGRGTATEDVTITRRIGLSNAGYVDGFRYRLRRREDSWVILGRLPCCVPVQ